jgi:hypothetical protein
MSGLAEFVAGLRGLPAPQLVRAIRAATGDASGVWIDPVEATPGGFGDHLWSVRLHGVSACGQDAEEACANWLRAARRAVAAVNETPKETTR